MHLIHHISDCAYQFILYLWPNERCSKAIFHPLVGQYHPHEFVGRLPALYKWYLRMLKSSRLRSQESKLVFVILNLIFPFSKIFVKRIRNIPLLLKTGDSRHIIAEVLPMTLNSILALPKIYQRKVGHIPLIL